MSVFICQQCAKPLRNLKLYCSKACYKAAERGDTPSHPAQQVFKPETAPVDSPAGPP